MVLYGVRIYHKFIIYFGIVLSMKEFDGLMGQPREILDELTFYYVPPLHCFIRFEFCSNWGKLF